MPGIQIQGRISDHPIKLGVTKQKGGLCPDILEDTDGDVVVIGADVTEQLEDAGRVEALVSQGERAVRIPRTVLESAVRNLAT